MGRKGSELDELQRIAKFFHSIVENMPAIVFVKDAEHLRFVMFNRAGEELIGIPRDDLLGKTDYDFFPPDEADFFRAKDKETIERGEVVEIAEEPLLTRNGERFLHTKKIVLADDNGKPQYLLGISQDITERRAAERDLEKLRASVAAAVVHDFRAPLQAILLHLETLAPSSTRDNAALNAHAAIRSRVNHLVRLTEDMLDTTRVAIEDVPLTREVVDLPVLVKMIVEALRPRLMPYGVEVHSRTAVPPVSVDPARLEQIIQNLLDNAAKHASSAVPIRVEVDRDATGACIRVIDHGPGIEPTELPHVFDRFYQTSRGRERKQGMGLGLFITKGLVAAHGGRIDIESVVGCGTTFRVWLPAVT